MFTVSHPFPPSPSDGMHSFIDSKREMLVPHGNKITSGKKLSNSNWIRQSWQFTEMKYVCLSQKSVTDA